MSLDTLQDTLVAEVQEPEALTRFLDPGSAATIWQREIPREVAHWLEALDPALLPSGRLVVPAAAVHDTMLLQAKAAGTPEGPELAWLAADIAALAKGFAEMMDTRLLRMRLDVVTTNACRKFHVDAITGRLVCTYRGTGTQYGLAEGQDDPTVITTVQTGAPILLRGTLWPPEAPGRLLHRSPPIEGTDETRLVLVLDPVNALDDLP